MNKKTCIFFLFIAPVLFFIMTGCLNFERRFPEKRYFVLEASRNRNSQDQEERPVLRINRFHVSPRYKNKGFVYRYDTMRYETDFYNEFFISPGLLVTEEVRRWLAESGLFSYVAESHSYAESEYILEGAITKIYGDYKTRTNPVAVLEMQFLFLHVTPEQSEIVLQKQFHREVPLKEDTTETLVEGWNSALQQILAAFEDEIKSSLVLESSDG